MPEPSNGRGALAAGVSQGIDQMRLDAQQPQLEHLEQAARARTDDHDFGDDRIAQRGFSSRKAPVRPEGQARPAFESVGVW